VGIALDEREQAELLGTHGVAVLATVAAGNLPVPLPVWYVVDDGVIYLRTPPSTKRLRDLAENPQVAFLVHGGQAWADLYGLLISGRAEHVSDPDQRQRISHLMAERFAELRPAALPTKIADHYAEPVVLRIAAERTVSWANRKLRL
jgi:nitroimidazol reductase NimA-like FMN-containing flavoprotein (pyridoxamine 5'-phosphate oxidase superfamily)